jgi:hypothetical protein
LAGAFRVDPTPPARGLGAEIDEVRGSWFAFGPASIDDPDGPTNVTWIPSVLAPFPVNILFPFGCEVFRRLYATTSPLVEDVTLVIWSRGKVY